MLRHPGRTLALWTVSWLLSLASITAAVPIDLTKATVVVRAGTLPAAEATAARVLIEEIQKRTGLHWQLSTNWPMRGIVIALSSTAPPPTWPAPRFHSDTNPHTLLKPEGFHLAIDTQTASSPIVWIQGADGRGTLFGVGELLRSARWGRHHVFLPAETDITTAPALPIRGHQLGYRHTANSYDGWDDRQFEQHIRELALFGANSIEGVPFQDTRKSPHMPLPRSVMNRRLSEICAQYDLDYWLWVPAEFDLNDSTKRAEHLAQHVALFRECPRLDALFFPGGDPGNNSPAVVLDFLEELSRPLRQYHPKATLWLSMQGFEKSQVDFVHQWIDQHQPAWLGGLVAGPSSPPLSETRARLPKHYGLRDYPDITHTVRCQYPVAWWDPAFHLTLGRESANPRPVFYKAAQDLFGQYTSGFITYSDGVHDDINKAVWSRLGWQPGATPREILLEYTRCFFGSDAAESAADGILALEKNWEGPLAENGSVESTLSLWQRLETAHPTLKDNWRWQLCLLRAYYDAYTRQRLIRESALEHQANQQLATAPARGSFNTMDAAAAQLHEGTSDSISKHRRARIGELCSQLFKSIRLQTSVPLYQASGFERGALLDFVDRPLNNQWWLEDEFKRIRALPTESERLKALELIRTWESPGSGSFYDEVGNIAKSPRVLRGEGTNTDPMMENNPNPGFWWWDEGSCRKRLSWQTSMDWPLGLKYQNLDPRASYRVRLTGYGQPKLRANGQALVPKTGGRIGIGEFQEYAVPTELLKEGTLTLKFDPLPEEQPLNWRQQSRVSEVWLLKQ